MSLLGSPTEERVREAWLAAMRDVLAINRMEEIPELNEFQCGTYMMHSLDDAKRIAQSILIKVLGLIKRRTSLSALSA